jgi:hypothetical protein
VEGTNAQLSALLAAWARDVAAEPFAHEQAVCGFAAEWSCRRRYLAGVRRVTEAAEAPPA